MKQHTVLVNAKGGKFVASTPDLTIDAGDLVLWNSLGSTPIAIAGDQAFFNSDRLFNEAGFSHAFGLPGEFRWADAFGSGLSGVVRVRDPGRCQDEESLRRWRKSLSKGTLVMIVDGKAEPAEVDIHTGQTVFFAIVKGPGVSITDERLLGIEKDSRNQCAAA
jgi:plastocyanin